MTVQQLRASLALHERRLRFVRGKLARVREEAHEDGLVTTQEAQEIHRLEARARRERELVERRDAQIAKLSVPRGTPFLPGVERGPGEDAGRFVPAGAKLVWHTTEGSSIAGAIAAYRSNGNAFPHFTFDPRDGSIVQHVAMNRAARALRHPAVVETNRAHAIQVELVGRAADTPDWDGEDYARIARLARRIEAATGVPRRAIATFTNGVHHLDPQKWLHGAGHCGHQHVPGNDHHDPGAFLIHRVV